jgi:restriction system protein
MDPYGFSELIGRLLAKIEFDDIEVTNGSGNSRIDVRGTLVAREVIRTRMAVQVKQWMGNLQFPPMQQVRGSLGAHDQGLTITTRDSSKGAQKEAALPDRVPVALMNGNQLVSLLVANKIGVSTVNHDLIEFREEFIFPGKKT